MRSYDTGLAPMNADAGDGWDARGGWDAGGGWEAVPAIPAVPGVRMAGFRDRAAGGLHKRVLPRPDVVVVIGFGEDPFTVDGATGRQSVRSFVAAPAPGPARVAGERVECVEMRLSPPAAYALLGGVLPHPPDRPVVGLDEVWGRQERQLRERLPETASWEERLALVDEFLTRRAARAPAMASEVVAAWEHIVTRRGRVRVGELAASCGWSRKRLWSRFTAQIGLTPKRAAMLVRFDHAARALRAGRSAADTALACGYTDQPHLHRDVLAFAGCTPGALAARAAAPTRRSTEGRNP
ncbi:helix-turn-helix domain-containing protein [Streptomyces mobaraensis]|uniref:helix-turn-helix domain-containing protein n=1 Tax=Streptomyces mobaraensis TaxID=35621 RepID=UPI0033EAA8B5